jgi:hypothetical protein
MDIITIHVYHIFRLKYRCFVYALSMIVPSLYCLYPISYTQKISKIFKIKQIAQDFKIKKKKKLTKFQFFFHKIHVLAKAWLKYMITSDVCRDLHACYSFYQ